MADYVEKRGGADRFLYFGRRRSAEIAVSLEFSEGDSTSSYDLRLVPNDVDQFKIGGSLAVPNGNHQDRFLKDMMGYQIYHFHDTSDSAPMKLTAAVDDNRFLRPNGENLAAFLYWMKVKAPVDFQRIRESVRSIAPFFRDFQLEPSRLNESAIRLEWNEVGSDAYFNASSLSDGTLRFICLATLLLQPTLPPLVLLDEPELGLHPAAIHLLAEMLKAASEKTQLIVAT
jgi:predicted ATPase